MPFYAAWVTHQVRLLETLTRLPLPDNLAVKLVAFQMRSQPRGHALGGTRYTPFVKRVVTDMDKLCAARGRSSGEQERRAIPRPAPATRHDIHHSVALFRRAHGLTDVLQRLPGSANVSARVRRLNVINATTRPLAAPVAQHLRTLYYGGQRVLPADLGTSVKETPMSIAGPNCGGALLAMTSRNWHSVRCIARLRMGALAFAVAPFHEGGGRWREDAALRAAAAPGSSRPTVTVAAGAAAAAVGGTGSAPPLQLLLLLLLPPPLPAPLSLVETVTATMTTTPAPAPARRTTDSRRPTFAAASSATLAIPSAHSVTRTATAARTTARGTSL
jgi:hypothetical protein